MPLAMTIKLLGPNSVLGDTVNLAVTTLKSPVATPMVEKSWVRAKYLCPLLQFSISTRG